jgi:lipoyl(octanoyl) transferase
MEQALCLAAAALGVQAGVRPPYTGIWSNDEKLASIGVAVRRGVTHHGFALNVSTDLAYFRKIVPCGLHWATMTSLEQLLGRPVAMEDAKAAVAEAFRAAYFTPP